MKIEHLKAYDALREAADDGVSFVWPSSMSSVDAGAVLEILNEALEDSARQSADAQALRVDFGKIHALIPIDVAPGHPQATRVREALRQATDAQKAARDLREQVATLTTALAKAKADAPEDDRASTYARQIAEAHAQLNACSIPAGRRTLAERCAMIAKGRIADRKARQEAEAERDGLREQIHEARVAMCRALPGGGIEKDLAVAVDQFVERSKSQAFLPCARCADGDRRVDEALDDLSEAERSLRLADAAADEMRAQRDLARKREADAGRRIGAMADTIERVKAQRDSAQRLRIESFEDQRAAEADAADLRAKLADILSRAGYA